MKQHWAEAHRTDAPVGLEDYAETLEAHDELNPEFFSQVQKDADFEAALLLLSNPAAERTGAETDMCMEYLTVTADRSGEAHASAVKRIYDSPAALAALAEKYPGELTSHLVMAIPSIQNGEEFLDAHQDALGDLRQYVLTSPEVAGLSTEIAAPVYAALIHGLLSRISLPDTMRDPSYQRRTALVEDFKTLMFSEPHSEYCKSALTEGLCDYLLSLTPEELVGDPLRKVFDLFFDKKGDVVVPAGFGEVKNVYFKYYEDALREKGMPYEWVQEWGFAQRANHPFEFIEENVAAIMSLEYRHPGAVAFLNEHYGIINFARYPQEALLRQVELHETQGPYGVVINAYADWNGALNASEGTLKDLYEQTKETLPMRIIEVKDRRDAARKLVDLDSRFGNQNKPLYMLVRAHGNVGHLALSEHKGTYNRARNVGKEYVSGLRFSRLAEILPEKPLIILQSCMTGVEGGLAQSVADSIPNSTVIAPDKSTNIQRIVYDKDKEGPEAFGVTYKDVNEGTTRTMMYHGSSKDGVEASSTPLSS